VVTLQAHTIDKYRRTVAEMYANGRNLNLQTVNSLPDFAHLKNLRVCDRAAYLGSERQAARISQGVWLFPMGLSIRVCFVATTIERSTNPIINPTSTEHCIQPRIQVSKTQYPQTL